MTQKTFFKKVSSFSGFRICCSSISRNFNSLHDRWNLSYSFVVRSLRSRGFQKRDVRWCHCIINMTPPRTNLQLCRKDYLQNCTFLQIRKLFSFSKNVKVEQAMAYTLLQLKEFITVGTCLKWAYTNITVNISWCFLVFGLYGDTLKTNSETSTFFALILTAGLLHTLSQEFLTVGTGLEWTFPDICTAWKPNSLSCYFKLANSRRY